MLDALLVGVPAVAGVLVGTWLQQRLPARSIALLFAARARRQRRRAGAAVIGAIVDRPRRRASSPGCSGVGGGVLFVPGLVLFLGLDQHQAEATSLLAIVPVAIVGTYRQDRYGNVRRPTRCCSGCSRSPAPPAAWRSRTPSRAPSCATRSRLMVFVAAQLVRRTMRAPRRTGAIQHCAPPRYGRALD